MSQKQNAADIAAQYYLSLEQKTPDVTRKASISMLVICGAILLLFGALLCFLPPNPFSPEENRSLATFPDYSTEALLDGSFTQGIADFCADQFPFRTTFVTAKAKLELWAGRQENNDVIAGNDGYLIKRPQYTPLQIQNMEQNLLAICRFEDALKRDGISFTFAVVPRSIDVNSSRLPAPLDASVAQYDRSQLHAALDASDLSLLDLTDSLRNAAQEKQVWYKTDHHWTMDGAYVAYVSLSEALGYTPSPLSDFTHEVVCERFLGTTQASSGMMWIEGEELTLLRYDGDEAFQTEIIAGGQIIRTLNGFYDFDALETHDEYNVFLGGTNTLIRVFHPERSDAPTLVLLKDSFSQSLAPLLARHFDLILVDPRTYNIQNGSLLSLIQTEEAEQVLLLYGLDTLYDSYSLKNLTFGLN